MRVATHNQLKLMSAMLRMPVKQLHNIDEKLTSLPFICHRWPMPTNSGPTSISPLNGLINPRNPDHLTSSGCVFILWHHCSVYGDHLHTPHDKVVHLMLLDSFLARGRDFLGSTYPIRCGAMTWVSGLELVSAVGSNGGFGLLAGGSLMAV
jgi:hypothetical protein